MKNYPTRSTCTTLVVTPKASADGKMRVAHSCDDGLADHRIVFVPAQDWPAGSMRPVYPSAIFAKELPQWNAHIIPRLYVPGRPDRHANAMGQSQPTLPIGSIPQVSHTYAYLDGNYGIMNEAGLMFGECTCTAKNFCDPEEGKRIFYSSELMRVALERCAEAVAAVELMGSLIEEYGYYGTGETVIVADANDAWVMEMAPAPEGVGGYWFAQQVPDGEFFVEANLFRLRDVDPSSPGQRMCKRLATEAKENHGIDWTALFSLGEYHHPYYSLRREWRALDLVAPSRHFSPKAEGFLTRQYPVFVKPDHPVSLEELFRIYRDHLEGTEFDLTKGPAAGPWGNPNHHRPTVEEEKTGCWERAISMVDTGYAYICEPGVCWMALGRPAEVPFVPLAIAEPPKEFSQGSPQEFAPESCAWWTYNLVSQYSELRYCHMIQDINQAQQLAESRARKALKEEGPMPDTLNRLAEETLKEWRSLFGHLAVTYDQGFYNTPDKFTQKQPCNPDYLNAVGFHDGPLGY